jgi:hypothetical protein
VEPCKTFIPGARAHRGILSLCKYPLAVEQDVEAVGGASTSPCGPEGTGVDTMVSEAIGSGGYDRSRSRGDLISCEGSGRELSLCLRRLAVGETDFRMISPPPVERVGDGR